jgi:hypothetical protein
VVVDINDVLDELHKKPIGNKAKQFKITNQNQKQWCEENVFDDVRVVVKMLI